MENIPVDLINTFLKYFLAFDIGVLIGMLLTAWFIGSKGCYKECLLTEPDDDSIEYWNNRLGRRIEDKS